MLENLRKYQFPEEISNKFPLIFHPSGNLGRKPAETGLNRIEAAQIRFELGLSL